MSKASTKATAARRATRAPAFLRARSPDQKEERAQALLRTARAMLSAGTPLSALSLNELARQVGMTKSNIYRYFESREAVLLAILAEEWQGWLDGLRAAPRPRGGGDELSRLVRRVARSLAARPLLSILTSALPSVLEENLSVEAIADFKRLTLAFFTEAAALLHAEAPSLSTEAALRFMSDSAIVIAGLYPHAFPPPHVKGVVDGDPAFAVFRHDYEGELARLLLALARALQTPSPKT